VIENVNAIPKNINGRTKPIFLKRRGITKIGRDTNKKNKQKISMYSNQERISELLIMY
jgi:hypothetical protein